MSKNKKNKKAKKEQNISFDPYFSEKAKMEVKVDKHGVSFVGNAEGYLSLSRFFTYLAEVHLSIREEPHRSETNTVQGYGAYHFKDYVAEEKIQQGDYLFRPGPIRELETDNHEQDVLFWLSDVIGPEFWLEKEKKGTKEKKEKKDSK